MEVMTTDDKLQEQTTLAHPDPEADGYNETQDEHEEMGIMFRTVYISVLDVIVVMGLLGNCFVLLYTMNNTVRKNSHAVFLGALAVVDSLVLINDCWTSKVDIFSGSTFACRVVSFVEVTVIMLASWFLVLLTLDRYIAVVFPLKRKSVFTRRRAVISCIATSMAIIGFRLLDLVYINITFDEDRENFVCKFDSGLPLFVYRVLTFVLTAPVPCGIVAYFNLHIVIYVIYRRTVIHRNLQERGGRVTSGSTIDRKTLSLLTVSVMGLITLVPISSLEVAEELWNRQHGEAVRQARESGLQEPPRPLKLELVDSVWPVLHLFCLLNNAINFYLLMFTNARFRAVLRSMICGRCSRLVSDVSRARDSTRRRRSVFLDWRERRLK